jgi:hypothetical protein
VAAQAHAGGCEREWLACLISYAFGQGRGSGGKWARRGGGVETGGLEFTRRRPTTHASVARRAKDWGRKEAIADWWASTTWSGFGDCGLDRVGGSGPLKEKGFCLFGKYLRTSEKYENFLEID